MLKDFAVCPTIPVTDLDRAVTFYCDVLGLKSKRVDKEMMVADLEAGGGSMLQLYQRGPSTADHTLATFEVKDIEGVVSGLKSKGVKVEDYDSEYIKTENGIATIGNEKASWFRDSEGNILCLHE